MLGDSFSIDDGAALVKPVGSKPELRRQQMPVPAPGHVLLRVSSVGLCRTDLLVADEKISVSKDVILGHEFSGVLAESNGPCSLPIGTRVSTDPTFVRTLDGTDGYMGLDIDGALATWAVVPATKIFDADGLSDEEAAYLEPIAAAMGGLEPAQRAGGRGLILGDNRIATLTSDIFRTSGIRFECLSQEAFRQQTVEGGRCVYDWILETKLEEDVLALAAEALKVSGRVILKSRHAKVSSFPAARWAEKQLSIVGRSRGDFPTAMTWLRENRGLVAPLLGESFPLARWNEAFEAAWSGDQGKIFILLSE